MISLYLSMVDDDTVKSKVVIIYENYYSFMAYTAGQILNHNKQDVEDAVHSAMLKIIENIDLIDTSDPRRVKNFCGVIAKNKAIDYLRSKNKEAISLDEDEVLTEAEDASGNPADIFEKHETYDAILGAIDSLPDTYKDVCLLKYVSCMKECEIAVLLGLTESNVGVRIHRAKQLIRESLRKENIYV